MKNRDNCGTPPLKAPVKKTKGNSSNDNNLLETKLNVVNNVEYLQI